jgi:hypothetical protein
MSDLKVSCAKKGSRAYRKMSHHRGRIARAGASTASPRLLGEHAGESFPVEMPAIEHRGEGVFIKIRKSAIDAWLARPGASQRIEELARGFERWKTEHRSNRDFPGGPYILLHSLSHLLLSAIAQGCGYPASSLRDRVYGLKDRYGILIHTGTSDAEGTLGGPVEAGRRIGDHLRYALELARLCSNDPVCADHNADDEHERRFLHGAACHGCLLIAETSREQRNDLLDRTLVVPTVANADAAFFREAAV